ncbi:MAG TPA: HNH endonuclease signature motif containing protein [Myxococcaceae bacterium]|nr:HNH endonuclease signature motif containing protein [Myxococcaceae bacterium]
MNLLRISLSSLVLCTIAWALVSITAHAEVTLPPPAVASAQAALSAPVLDGPPHIDEVLEPQGIEPIAGKRPGARFSQNKKEAIKQKNAQEHEGKNQCENCDVQTVPPKKHTKGVTPPLNETHVDHKIPRAEGGPAEPDNGQVLCRDCNLKKGAKVPPAEPER